MNGLTTEHSLRVKRMNNEENIPVGYCRYCSNAYYQGNRYAVCEVKNRVVLPTSKRKTCKGFEFCNADVFSSDSMKDGFREYKPRTPKKKQCDGQIQMEL